MDDILTQEDRERIEAVLVEQGEMTLVNGFDGRLTTMDVEKLLKTIEFLEGGIDSAHDSLRDQISVVEQIDHHLEKLLDDLGLQADKRTAKLDAIRTHVAALYEYANEGKATTFSEAVVGGRKKAEQERDRLHEQLVGVKKERDKLKTKLHLQATLAGLAEDALNSCSAGCSSPQHYRDALAQMLEGGAS